MQFGGASLYVAGVMITVMALTFGGVRGIPRDAAIVLLAHNPRIISLASRQSEPGGSLVIPTEAKLTCRFLVQFMAALRSVLRIQDWVGPLGDDTNLCQPRNWHDRVAMAVTLPAEITRLELLPGTSESSRQPPRTGAGSNRYVGTPLPGRGMSPAGN